MEIHGNINTMEVQYMKSILTLVTRKEDRTLRKVKLNMIARNPNQPRKYFDPEAIAQLAESIRQYGVLNPLTVRRLTSGEFELIAGERRLRAARVAGLNEVPCLVISANEESSSAIALVENLQRRDLDFFEEANGFKQLIDKYGLTQEEVARKVGKTQSSIANKLRLLRLSAENIKMIRRAGLAERHARALLRLESDEERLIVTRYIIENELNVSRTEEFIDKMMVQKLEEEVPKSKGCQTVVKVIRDVRFFLNTVDRAVGVMVDSGIDAKVNKKEEENGILLTIHIPNTQN